MDFDGTITWNGAAVDRATMDAYFEDAGLKKNPQPEIHVSRTGWPNMTPLPRCWPMPSAWARPILVSSARMRMFNR